MYQKRGKNSAAVEGDEVGREMLKVFTKMSAEVTKPAAKKSTMASFFSIFSRKKKE